MKMRKRVLALVSSLALLTVMLVSVLSVSAAVPALVDMQNFDGEVLASRYSHGYSDTVDAMDAPATNVVERDGDNKWYAMAPADAYVAYAFIANSTQDDFLGSDWAGYAFYLKTAGKVELTPNVDSYVNNRLYVLTGADYTLIDTLGNVTTVTPGAGGLLALENAFEGWVIVPKSGMTDAWDPNASNISAVSTTDKLGVAMMANFIKDGTMYVDDVRWITNVNAAIKELKPAAVVTAQDFDGQVIAGRYAHGYSDAVDADGAAATNVVDRAGDNKWFALAPADAYVAYAFNVNTPIDDALGNSWAGYAFYLKTAGKVELTPNVDSYLNNRLYVLTGADYTLIDTVGNVSTVTPGAGGLLALENAFEGWVIVPKSGMTDAWDPNATNVNDVSTQHKLGLVMMANFINDGNVYVDDFSWFTDVDAAVAALRPSNMNMQDFDGEVIGGRYAHGYSDAVDADGAPATNVVERDGSNKWYAMAPADAYVAYAFNVNSPLDDALGNNWAGYAFYLKTAGKVELTPNMDSYVNNRLYVLTGADYTLIDTDGNVTTVTPGTGGLLKLDNAFEGWVVVPKAGMTDAWDPNATSVNDVSTQHKLGLVMMANFINDGTMYVDDCRWLMDVDQFIENPATNEKEPVLLIAVQPAGVTATEGKAATFAVEPYARNDGEPAYQWQVSTDGTTWTNVEGANAASYTIEATKLEQNGEQYRCVITSNTLEVTSDPATLTVAEKINLTDAIIENFDNGVTKGIYGTELYLTDREGGGMWTQFVTTGEYSFKAAPNTYTDWEGVAFYVKTTGNLLMFPLLGYTGDGQNIATFFVPPVNGGKFVVIDTEGNRETKLAEPGLGGGYEAWGHVNFTEAFEGWVYVSKADLVDFWNSGTNLNSLLPSQLLDIMFHIEAIGSEEQEVTANIDDVKWVFNEEEFLNSLSNSEPSMNIIKNPDSAKINKDNAVSFTVEAENLNDGDLKYQWEKSTDGSTWTSIEGATAATYTIDAVKIADNNTQYRCVVSGDTLNMASEAATLTVFVTLEYEAESKDKIDAAIFEEAKGTDVVITINVNNYGEMAYSWTIVGKDIAKAMAFDPHVNIGDIAEIGLDSKAPDALYFTVVQEGNLPGKMTLSVDTGWNFFENDSLWLYSVGKNNSLTKVAEGMIAGVAYSDVQVTAGGSYVLNSAVIEGAQEPSEGDGSEADKDTTSPGTGETSAVVAALALTVLAGAVLLTTKKRSAVK